MYLLPIALEQSCIATEASATAANSPHFTLNLTLNEFSVLNVAEMDGLLKYGGSGDFRINMVREGSNVVWNVTVDNPRLMELLGIFVGERTMKLVQSINPNNLDPNQKIALETVKTLSIKLEEARRNPVWNSVTLSGLVALDGTNCVLQGKEDTYKVVGDKLADLKVRAGRPVLAEGFLKAPGQFEISQFMDQRTNTLELFVMSHCPFGQRAENMLFDFLSRTNLSTAARLEIHYIFYKQNKGGKDVFISMHGDAEVNEDLVQMTIRNHFPPKVFESYLRIRNKDGSGDWKKLAQQAGLTIDNLGFIEGTISANRDSLIRAEYDYVAGQCKITDGSPSYLWESEKVTDIRKLPAFKGIDSPQESCSN